jgi:hypothetical protein
MSAITQKVQATETFAADINGRVFFVRTGDQLPVDHPVVAIHPTRFDHHVQPQAPDQSFDGS